MHSRGKTQVFLTVLVVAESLLSFAYAIRPIPPSRVESYIIDSGRYTTAQDDSTLVFEG